MRLLALVAGPDHVCCRYRLLAFRERWRQWGYSLDLEPCPRTWGRWLRLAPALRRADVVILQRNLLTRGRLLLLRMLARKLVFDFDDAVFLNDSFDARGLASGPKQRGFARVVRAADAVVAGNDYLAEAARRCGSSRVVVIPTVVDVEAYAHDDSEERNFEELVWIGSSSTLRGLERCPHVWHALAGEPDGVRLKVIADRPFFTGTMAMRFRPWSKETEARELARSGIGISWIPDDPWSRGKCGLKVLQYMAAGLPVVANPVGVHVDLVRHGETGFLAESPSEWVERVGELTRSPTLCRRMGEAGRRRVDREFGIDRAARTWREVLAGS